MVPFLYAIMVPLEASISGTSTNPARTMGPALISGQWEGWWVYWAGPLTGALVAVVVFGAPDLDVAVEDRFTVDDVLYRIVSIAPNRDIDTQAEAAAVE